jgi:hypothetical protein
MLAVNSACQIDRALKLIRLSRASPDSASACASAGSAASSISSGWHWREFKSSSIIVKHGQADLGKN